MGAGRAHQPPGDTAQGKRRVGRSRRQEQAGGGVRHTQPALPPIHRQGNAEAAPYRPTHLTTIQQRQQDRRVRCTGEHDGVRQRVGHRKRPRALVGSTRVLPRTIHGEEGGRGHGC